MNAYYRSSQLLQRLNKCLAGFRPCGEVVSIESDGIVGDKRVIVNKIELARLTFARGDHLIEYLLCLANLLPLSKKNFLHVSGGNMQKVLLGKWLFADPDILILDEPTRGIDVGAKYEIYCIINKMVAEGKSVILISSEMPEVLGMSDRIYVMNEGRMVAEMDAKDANQEKIMACIINSDK